MVGKPEGGVERERERPLRRHKRIWKHNIRMDIREVGWEVMDWMHLAQERDQ